MRSRSWVLIVAVALLAGCSSADGSEESAGDSDGPLAGVDVSDASDAQAAEISDGEVTVDEYRAAFQRYRECLSAAGFELVDVEFSNPLYDYGVPNAAVEEGAEEECYLSEFRYTDILWQTSDHVQDNSETARVFRECLTERGIDPADSVAEMEGQLEEAGIDASECL